MSIPKHSSESAIELNFNDLFDQAPIGILVSSMQGEILKANIALLELLGYDQEEFLMIKQFNEIIHPEDLPAFQQEEKKLVSGQIKKITVRNRLITKENKEILVLYSAGLSHDGKGNSSCINGYIAEVGAGRTISPGDKEIDLLCLNAIIKNYPDPIYFKNINSQFLKVSDAYLTKYKIDGIDSLLGKTDFDLFTEEHATKAFNNEQTILKTGLPISDLEEKETTPEGRVTWAASLKMPFLDDTGAIIGTFGISQDITEEKLKEAGIREKTNILKAVTSKMPVVIYKFDKQSGINSLLGDSEITKVFEQTKVVRLAISDALVRIVGKIKSQQGDQGYFNFMSSLVTTEGERNFENFIFENEAVQGEFIGLALDITERKRNQQNLKRNAKSLEKINKELNQFAYIISHDLKAPLRAIINLSEWIKEDLEDTGNADVKENLKLMSGRVHRMENLINGILAYSRVSRVTINYEDIEVGPFLTELIDSLMLPEKFTVKIADNLPTISYPAVNLEQVFSNLISNAAKYNNNPKGTIDIGYRIEESHYEFWVADDGPGILPEYHEKIFQIFQTLQARDTVESTGIGLTIVKKIIEERGGAVWVESEPGNGSKFIFTVPIKN